MNFATLLKIPNFRGVFMRDQLPESRLEIESGILNLDSLDGPGTHWTLWIKTNRKCYYFDSYGIQSPKEFDEYMKYDITYSTYNIQKNYDIICGHLCLVVLYEVLINKKGFHKVILELFSLIK